MWSHSCVVIMLLVAVAAQDPVKMQAGIAGDENAVVTGELGKPLNIRCLAYGSPPPTVFWYRGHKGPMVPFISTLYEHRRHDLLIRTLNYETLGEYVCQAYNFGEPISWSIIVTAYKPDGETSDNPYIITRGNRHPLNTIKSLMDKLITTPTTTLSPETNKEVGSRQYANYGKVTTNISSEELQLSVGAELSLPCEVDGYPEPEVYWTKDGARLSPSDRISITGSSVSRLRVSRVTLQDGGEYGCHAANAYSSHSSTVHVSVEVVNIPANCTDNPLFANCRLIVRSNFCNHPYYSKFCCKSCMEALQLTPQYLQMQADQSIAYKKK